MYLHLCDYYCLCGWLDVIKGDAKTMKGSCNDCISSKQFTQFTYFNIDCPYVYINIHTQARARGNCFAGHFQKNFNRSITQFHEISAAVCWWEKKRWIVCLHRFAIVLILWTVYWLNDTRTPNWNRREKYYANFRLFSFPFISSRAHIV